MKITAIKQQVKRLDRYSVYVDGSYVCAFSESEVLALEIHVGQELNSNELEQLKDDSTKDKARYLALGQLARRPRSEWELRDYLKRKDYSPEIIEWVVSQLVDYGYIDDKKFAEAWVSNRRLLKPTSHRRLKMELRQKRVADEIINTVLAEDDTDELTVLVDLVARKQKQTKYQDTTKLTQYLLRQGYDYENIKLVISSLSAITD